MRNVVVHYISDPKSYFFCDSSETNFIPQPQKIKVVEGKHNVLVHYVDVSATGLFGVVFCNPFKWIILYFIFSDPKSCYFCVPASIAKWILFLNHRNRKVIGCQHNVLIVHYLNITAPNLFGVVLCNPFKWDILWFISDQKSCFLCACLKARWDEFNSSTTGIEKL